MAIRLESRYADHFLDGGALSEISPKIKKAHEMLHNGTGAGNDFTGWLDLPANYDRDEFARVKKAAEKIRSDSDVLVVVGIGGSYLGARAAIEFLNSPNYNLMPGGNPRIIFAGNTLSPSALKETLALCEGKRVSVNVISKSGTTTEPAIAFRVLREMMAKKYPDKEELRGRIYCTTDKARGTLHGLAVREGYERFVIPDDVGGRYSVLTPVGLLPIAVAGADIDALMAGAAAARDELTDPDVGKNDCYKYAAIRNILYDKGYGNELFVAYEPSLQMLCEWWKQLYGESEGKDGKGIFPAGVVFSTDLHSMGQYIQSGVRNLFETVCLIGRPADDMTLGVDPEDVDGLNFLAGKTVDFVNKKAFEGTVLAHNDGNVPNIVLHVPRRSEFELGYLIYFFEKSCAVSGYVLGINPFDQPGVEAYKENMFALLGKPGFEAERARLEARLNK